MLDKTSNTPDHAENARPQRRRRRAASRPAGPPAPVAEPSATEPGSGEPPADNAFPEENSLANNPSAADAGTDEPLSLESDAMTLRPENDSEALRRNDSEALRRNETVADVLGSDLDETWVADWVATDTPALDDLTTDDDVTTDDDLTADDASTDEPNSTGSTRMSRVLLDPFRPRQVVTPSWHNSETDQPATPDGRSGPPIAPDLDSPSDSADEALAAESDEDDDEDEDRPRRRRRRRGGRRRRRGGEEVGDDDAAENGDDQAASDGEGRGDEPTASDDEDSAAVAGDDDSEEGQSGGRRRRRRRRRRGEDASGSDDDPSDVVVRVRDGRRSKASDEVTGIDGSTRMEAKRQRRREGRSASRRRAPVLSEAEFLARRESVKRSMVIRQNEELSQIAVLEDGVLVEHYVDRASATSLIGNVYLGRVQNVLPAMEAAFIDIGRGRNAVLYAGEVDWDAFGAEGEARKVENVLKSGQTVLVQVTKDPVGAKGARLTAYVSLPGRYIVYAPSGHLSGISRKLPDTERKRLKEILADLVEDNASVIVRTAAEGATEDELVRDVTRLKAQWEAIQKQAKTGSGAPKLLYGEPDLTVRIVRDLFTEDFSELIIDGNDSTNDAYETVTAYVDHVAPHLADRIQRWDREQGDCFAANRIDEQIAKALERKVFLPSGGSLIIDRTEAMTVIDVNTGKFTGNGGNLEATVTSNNLEAAEEIIRQLRLRDIGGIIVIDFIDMVLPSNRELLLRRLVECLGRDRTRHQVAEVTSLGLVQMTRKKVGTGLAEAFTEECQSCAGRGYEIHDMPVESQAPSDGGERKTRGRRGSKERGGRGDSSAKPGGRSSHSSTRGRERRNGRAETNSNSSGSQSGESQSGESEIGDLNSAVSNSSVSSSGGSKPDGSNQDRDSAVLADNAG